MTAGLGGWGRSPAFIAAEMETQFTDSDNLAGTVRQWLPDPAGYG